MKFLPRWIAAAVAAMVAVCASAESQMLLTEIGDVRLGNRQSREWTFRAVDPTKGRVVVEFRNRIDYPKAAGWCPCWQIAVNGRTVTAAATRSEMRLLNKPYHLQNRWHGSYPADNHSDKWFALYLPDFKTAEKQFNPPTQEATRTVLDISDLVRMDGTNTITLRAGGISRSFYTANNVTNHKPQVVFGGLKVYAENVPTRLQRMAEKEIRASMKGPLRTDFLLKREASRLMLKIRSNEIPPDRTFF